MSAANVFFIAGAPGMGKTSLIQWLILERQLSRVITMDHYAADTDGIKVDEVVIENLPLALKRISELSGSGSWSLGYVPNEGSEPEEAAPLAHAAYERAATLIIDEAHSVCGQHTVADEVLKIARRGRHRGARLILATLRPADVHRALTSHSERAFFWMKEPADREYVRRTLGDGAAQIVRALQPGQFVYDYLQTTRLCKIEWKRSVPVVTTIRELTPEEVEG